MVLPQSDAFKTLATRLHSVPVQALQQLSAPSEGQQQSKGAIWDQHALISTFRGCQVRTASCRGRGRLQTQAACTELVCPAVTPEISVLQLLT